ncbi:MAG: CPBP family intramembrane metalloprotease [Clostridia bacterium]|nr:CPBP family intramembrane metalloprotease [Clostridia bacterium]
MNKRAIRPEDAVLVYLIGLGLYQITGVILSLAFKQKGDAYLFLAYAMPQIFYIATAAVYFPLLKVRLSVLPAREDVKICHYLFAAITGLGLFFFALLPNHGVTELFAKLGRTLTVNVPSLDTPGNIVLGVLILCVLPAIGEELVFRKVFCDGFSAYGKIPAILLSGVLFGLGHFNLAQTVHQIALGIVLSYLYVKTKNVTLTSLIHFGNNFLALFMTKITGEARWKDLTVLGVCFAVGAVLLVGGLLYFYFRTPKLPRKGKWVGKSDRETEESSDTEIVAIYSDGERIEASAPTVERRQKPSLYVVVFFCAVAVFWLIAAIFG